MSQITAATDSRNRVAGPAGFAVVERTKCRWLHSKEPLALGKCRELRGCQIGTWMSEAAQILRLMRSRPGPILGMRRLFANASGVAPQLAVDVSDKESASQKCEGE